MGCSSHPARLGLKRVSVALYALAALIQDVGVDHLRVHVLVAEQLLNRPDVIAVFQQMSGEEVPAAAGASVRCICW